LGTTAARLLLDRRQGDTSPAKKIVMKTALKLRDSVAPPTDELQYDRPAKKRLGSKQK